MVKVIDKKIESVIDKVKGVYENMNTSLNSFQETSEARYVSVENKLKGFREFLALEKESLSNLRFHLQKDNVDHHTSVSNSVLTLNNLLQGENKLMGGHAKMTQKKKLIKEKLDATNSLNAQISDELLLVKSCNLAINQHLLKIVEDKDAPYVDYISQLMDVTFSSTIPQIKKILWMLNLI